MFPLVVSSKFLFPKEVSGDSKDGFINASMDAFCKFITIAKLCGSRLADENIDKDIKIRFYVFA